MKKIKERELELRYYDAENLIKDFQKPEEVAAMKAVLKWLDLNLIVAWEDSPGIYRVNYHANNDNLNEAKDCVLRYENYSDLKKALEVK